MKRLLVLLLAAMFALPVQASGISDGAIVKTANNPDIYIVKYSGGKVYKRLILNPKVFDSYQHLKWENVITISQSQMDSYTGSSLVKVDGYNDVYQLVPNGDIGDKYLVTPASSYDLNSVYIINDTDFNNYTLAGNVSFNPVYTPAAPDKQTDNTAGYTTNNQTTTTNNTQNTTNSQTETTQNTTTQTIPVVKDKIKFWLDTNDVCSAADANYKCGLNLSEEQGGISSLASGNFVFYTLHVVNEKGVSSPNFRIASFTFENNGTSDLSKLSASARIYLYGKTEPVAMEASVSGNQVIFTNPYPENYVNVVEVSIDPSKMTIGETIALSLTNVIFSANSQEMDIMNVFPLESSDIKSVVRCTHTL